MKNLVWLLCILVGFTTCKKAQNTYTLNSSGTITGSISPIQASATIILTASSGKTIHSQISLLDGTFTFENLPAGKYLLSTPTNGVFLPLMEVPVQVNAGKKNDLGILFLKELSLAKGLVTGKLVPVGFGRKITATNLSTGEVFNLPINTQTGSFANNLVSGTYTLSFETITSAEAPPNRRITLNGDHIDLGELLCKSITSASIIGRLNPITAVANISASNLLDGTTTIGVINRSTGEFEFPALDPSRYQINISTHPPYKSFPPIEISLLSKQNIDLGNFSFEKDADIRFLTYKINGVTLLRYNQSCSFTNGVLSFSISERSASMIDVNRVLITTFSLSQENITGLGKYTLLASGSSHTSFEEKRSVGSLQLWDLKSATANGQLEITAFDPVKRTIKGTFSTILVNQASPALPNKVLNEGSFYLNY